MEKLDSTPTDQSESMQTGAWGRWKAGSLSRAGASVVSGARTFVLTWAAMTIALQGVSMIVQSYQESERAPLIAAMKAELEWLEASGLAPKARVGVAAKTRLGHAFGSQSEAAMSEERSWGGWSVVSPMAKALPSMPWAGWNPSEARYLISAPDHDIENFEPRMSKPGVWDSERQSVLPSVLRHEAGHALAYENKWGPGRPAVWSESAARIAGRIVRSQMERPDASTLAQEPWQADWRAKWMSGIWNESFADAYSCVSAAKKGESKSCAMSRHARRIFPATKRDATSIVAAGSDHAVEMASFMVAQLDGDALAKLDPKQMAELSKSVANESLAWALARQGNTLGFFSESGLNWWLSAADSAGVDAIPTKKAWRELASASAEERPKAAAGPFEWSVGGHVFKAQGLGRDMPSGWRYDGLGGQVVFEEYIDATAMGDFRLLITADGSIKSGGSDLSSFESSQIDDKAMMAAVDVHLGLAKKSSVSMEAEVSRLREMFWESSLGLSHRKMIAQRAQLLVSKPATPVKGKF